MEENKGNAWLGRLQSSGVWILGIVLSFFKFLWTYKKRIFIGTTVTLTVIVVGLIATSLFVWMDEKPRVVKNMDAFAREINVFETEVRQSPIRIVDRNGVLIGEFYRKNIRPIRVDNLKEHQMFVWALLSAEDRNFYDHGGINLTAVLRAVVVNLSKFRFSQGGSTITQQLAKLSLDLGGRNLFNKITEVYATYYIEGRFSKDEILAMYLNKIFLGHDNTGVESAAQFYFNKSATQLTPAEAAMIAGLVPAPSVFNPVSNLRIALTKQRTVLGVMATMTDPRIRPPVSMVPENFPNLVDESIRRFRRDYRVEEFQEEGKRPRFTSQIGSRGYDKNFKLNLTPDFNMEIRKYIVDNYPEDAFDGKEITIHTTLDYEKQKIAETALKDGVEDIRKRILALANPPKDKKGKSTAEPIDEKIVQEIASGMRGSFVGLNARNGDVEVFVNNLRIQSYRPNRIETSFRQPGSTIKALVYALAYEKRLVNPSSIVVDEAINIAGYSPKNWYAGFKGNVTVRRAFAQSMNTIPVKLLRDIGMDYFLSKTADILSMERDALDKRFNRNLSLALGSGELTPMELAVIYATLQNGGRKVTPRKILKITDAKSIEDLSFPEPETYQVLDPIACAMALDSMQAVLSEEGTMPIRIPEGERFPMGGKTGTVQSPASARKRWGNIIGVRDAWFSGAIPGLSSVVWIGNEVGAPFPGSGSGTTGKVWWNFANAVSKIQGISGRSLLTDDIQGGFLRLDICADDGTQLELDWDKEYVMEMPISSVQNLPNENSPPQNTDPSIPQSPRPQTSNPETDSYSVRTRNQTTDPTSPQAQPVQRKNPFYCKSPVFGQYYYVGDGARRRQVSTRIVELSGGVEIRERVGESEIQAINQIDASTMREMQSGFSDSMEPVIAGGVELEEPSTYTPLDEDND